MCIVKLAASKITKFDYVAMMSRTKGRLFISKMAFSNSGEKKQREKEIESHPPTIHSCFVFHDGRSTTKRHSDTLAEY
ncbi:hypothetical protein DMJ13_20980 [halophilic archaeon]|nr:hypothetical protein DMJ13_20980 [halophilic archaeon]